LAKLLDFCQTLAKPHGARVLDFANVWQIWAVFAKHWQNAKSTSCGRGREFANVWQIDRIFADHWQNRKIDVLRQGWKNVFALRPAGRGGKSLLSFMKRLRLLSFALSAALVLGLAAPPPARADTDGAAITVGLLAAVVGCYFLVALQDDVERYADASPSAADAALARAAAKADSLPLVFDAPLFADGPAAPAEPSAAIAAVGVQWRF